MKRMIMAICNQVLVYRMAYLIILIASNIALAAADPELHANGPFGKRHTADDGPSPSACNRGAGISSPFFSQQTEPVQNIQASKTLYMSSEHIHLTWTPRSTSLKDDFVGIFNAEVPIENACDYLDYEFVQHQQSNMSWKMTHLRRPLEFRYYSRNDTSSRTYSLIAKSNVIQPKNYNEPTHIHTAYGDGINQMYVSYLTSSSQYIPQCQYGLSRKSLSFRQSGTTTTYKASDMCEGIANIIAPGFFVDPGYMHTILLKDLKPSTTYYYRVGTDGHGWSPIYSFTNRPANKEEEVYIIAYGDMGVANVAPGARSTVDRVTARVASTKVTCLLHIGDISYARGAGALWDGFMSQIQPIATRVPYMVGIGNHEYDHVQGGERDPSGAPGPGGFRPGWGNYGYDSGGECAVPVVHRFHSPSNGNGIFWYSFDVGPVHVLLFSTEHDFSPTSPQYAWIEKDLHSVDRSVTPWIIVGSHRHMYTTEVIGGGEVNIANTLQAYVEPLLYKYHVDVNLFAHRHLYERTCAMYQNKCVADGVTHVLIGMSGQSLFYSQFVRAEWSIYHDVQFGYGTIFANKTYLRFVYHRNFDDNVADQFALQK